MNTPYFRELGTGIPVLLLHGFPFTHQIWDSFAQKLSQNFHVITPDLPGFGKSPLPVDRLSIDLVAEILIGWLREKKVSDAVVIGHSLGGYVTLAMAKKAPEVFAAIGLFHSTAFADSAEKKESRNKVIEFINKNGVERFTSNFISPLFADQNHNAIKTIQAIAIQASEHSVKAYTLAMRDRADLTSVLSEFKKPVIFIAGEKDGGIPLDAIRKQALLSSEAEVHVLPDVAHMGMVEREDQTIDILRRFIKKNGVTSK
ncbi:MAG TPA: alpha/beta hydrolase [Chryseosolibacter sp.]